MTIISFIAASVSGITALSLKRQGLDIERARCSYAARSACTHTLNYVFSLPSEMTERELQGISAKKEERLSKEETPKEVPLPMTEEELTREEETILEKAPGSKGGKDVPTLLTGPYVRVIKAGNITCKTRIEDEAGKFNLNTVNEERKGHFHKFLLAAGVSSAEADSLTDSVLDWLDKDDRPHANGAESEYYQSLPRPYEPRNGPFQGIEELSLIKDVTPAVYGLIRDKITIYGDKININYAPREVLASLPHMDLDLADRFIKIRDVKGFIANPQKLSDTLFHLGITGSKLQDLLGYITLETSRYLSIDSLAYGERGSFTYRILVTTAEGKLKVLAAYPDW